MSNGEEKTRLFIAISTSNPDPMYKQITDQIKESIAAGAVSTGQKLPSIREMAEELNISVITIKRAYRDLESEGLITTRAGMGSFVSDLDHGKLRTEKLRELRGMFRAIAHTAHTFGITVGELRTMFDEEVDR